jgi:hypothetical protein
MADVGIDVFDVHRNSLGGPLPEAVAMFRDLVFAFAVRLPYVNRRIIVKALVSR